MVALSRLWCVAGDGIRCDSCSSDRLVPATDVGRVDESTGKRVDGSAVRVLVDVEARSDGEVRVTRLHADRLAPIRYDESLLSLLDHEASARLNTEVPDAVTWVDLHEASRVHVVDAVDALLRPRWPGKPRRSKVPVELSVRLMNLNPSWKRPRWEFPWLEVVDLDEAVARAAACLKSGDVKVSLYGSSLSLDDGGDRLRLGIRVPTEVVLTQLVLSPKGRPSEVLAEFDAATFLARDRMTPVLDARLPASALWHLTRGEVQSESGAELRARFRGMEKKPLRVGIPCGILGLRGSLVDVFLDLGSTTTKYIIRVGDSLSTPQVKRTAQLTTEWSLPKYDKAGLLSDRTGAAWARWVSDLLPALRRYAAREHRGHLRSVHLTVPESGALDVSLLAKSISAGSTTTTFSSNRRTAGAVRSVVKRAVQGLAKVGGGLDGEAIRALVERAHSEAVVLDESGPIVVLTPEHEAVARHYLAPLGVLHEAATAYHNSYRSRESQRAHQTKRRKEWRRKRAEQKEFDDSFFVWKWFNTRPSGPSGSRPTVSASLASPADWMERLVGHPELLKRIVLLDAGGLSLDIAVLESNKLISKCSRSDASCGGEAVTRALAERVGLAAVSSEDGTRQKARLGVQWTNPANTSTLPWDQRFGRFGGRHQKAYREVTWSTYWQAVDDLAKDVADRWKVTPEAMGTVLLTGGGSRNPHFQELVAECFAEVGLEADVVDARGLHDLLDEARAFKQPLPALSSPAVNLFTTVHGWALGEVRGAERMAYDKYAVVGGLLAGAQG